MNTTDLGTGAWHVFGILSVEILAVIAFALAVERRVTSASWRRVIWQICFVSMAGLVVCDLSGAGRRVMFQSSRAEADLNVLSSPTVPKHDIVSPAASLEGTREDSWNVPAELRALMPGSTAGAGPLLNPVPAGRMSHPGAYESGVTGSGSSEQSFSEVSWSEWMTLAWITGTVVLLLRICFSRFLFLLFRGQFRPLTDADLTGHLREVAERLGYRRRVHLVESMRLGAPVAFGMVRPTIAVPVHFRNQFSPTEQQTILAHELAHLVAADPGWRLLTDLVAAAVWWHPLVWWGRMRWEEASETAADEASLVVRDGPGALAASLLKIGSRLSGPPAVGWLNIKGNGFRSALGRRVERLMNLGDRRWTRPGGLRVAVARFLAPIVLVVVAIAGTAWTNPETFKERESMTTFKQTWQRTIATLALATVAAENPGAAAAAENHKPSGNVASKPSRSSGRTANEPVLAMSPEGQRRYGPAQPPHSKGTVYRMDPELMRRYGMVPSFPPAAQVPSAPQALDEARASVQAKLENIVLDELFYDGVQLGDVLEDLKRRTRSEQPQNRGVNFLISNRLDLLPGEIDPMTGAPRASSSKTEIWDTWIDFNLPLHQVRLKDALDAIVRVANAPIHYSVEPYGVVFAPGHGPFPSVPADMVFDLQVRTFHVNTNTFFNGLESAFGLQIGEEDLKGTPSDRSRKIQGLLGQVFQQLGIQMASPQKWFFYNDVTGVLMVRGTPEDLEIVQAAVETLGGGPSSTGKPDAHSIGTIPR